MANFDRARRGPTCRACPRGLGRRGAGALRGAADHGRRGRRGPSDALQGPGPARARARARRAGPRRRAGPHARRRPARPRGPDHRLHAGRQREHGRVRPRAARSAARAHEAGAWVHVDGAFGLWAAAAPGRAHLVRGVETADSWATDAHKWLNVPYDSGLVFVREPASLHAAMGLTAAYLPSTDAAGAVGAARPRLSRRARGVEVWAALRSLGRDGRGRPHRARLPPCVGVRRRPRRRRLRDPQRGRAEPGAGVVRRRRRPRAG